MATVSIQSTAGKLLTLLLANDDQGAPQFRSGNQEFLQSSVQVGEPGYANFLPRIGGVYAQANFGGGVGSKIQKPSNSEDATRYWYAERADCSSGRAQKGPKVTTLTAPANSGAMTGSFVLGSSLYLMLGRKIVSWDSNTDALTEARDYTIGFTSSGSAVFSKLGTEAAIETNTGVSGATADIQSADTQIAQQLRTDDTSVLFLSRVDVQLVRTGTVSGDVRLQVCVDQNGRPGQVIGSARQLAANVGTSATVVSFRFDDDQIISVPYNEPMWMVMDVAAASATAYIQWTRGTVSGYSRGDAYLSTDGGNSFSVFGTTDCYFNVYAKTPATTAYVGATSASKFMATTTNGTVYTDDTYRASSKFALIGDRMVRDVLTAGANGAIEFSDDGVNWSEAIPIGDVGVNVTNLLALNNTLIVCKADSIWAVDPITQDIALLHATAGGGNAGNASNGLGSAVWRDAAYIPFGSRLIAIQGDFDTGFTIYSDVSPTVLPEWGFPHGVGRVCAVAGDRFHLYALLSGDAAGYRVYKAANPLKKSSDDRGAPDWHGSLQCVGDSTQTIQYACIYDAGGTTSPHLFVTADTTGNVARIRLPRTADPASDSAYEYDTSNPGVVYLPDSTLSFAVHPKAWLSDAVTFSDVLAAGDYVDLMYNRRDAESWKRTGRLWGTGVVSYPVGLESRLLGRQIQIVNSSSTTSPQIASVGLTGAVRPIDADGPREITFTVQSENGLSADSLGQLLGVRAATQQRTLQKATRGGTRTLVGPRGEVYRSVLFLDVADILTRDGDADLIQVQAVQVG